MFRQYHGLQKTIIKDSVTQLYKDFRQQQQKQRAEDDKRLREKLFREAEKTQFKMNIIKGKEEEVTIETE